MRNLQEQVKKAFCYQKLFWPFTIWINCSSDFKTFANSQTSASNFKSFSRSLEQFFLTVGQNDFGNKIPFQLIFADAESAFLHWQFWHDIYQMSGIFVFFIFPTFFFKSLFWDIDTFASYVTGKLSSKFKITKDL